MVKKRQANRYGDGDQGGTFSLVSTVLSLMCYGQWDLHQHLESTHTVAVTVPVTAVTVPEDPA